VLATASIELQENPTDGHLLTIGAVTYRFKTTPVAAYDVAINAGGADLTSGNLAALITSGEIGVTPAHPLVTAALSGEFVILTARAAGAAGNGILISTTTPIDADLALTGGVDATAGFLGSMRVVAAWLYVVSSVTSGIPNWRRVALASF
jgi:hypothetical protein